MERLQKWRLVLGKDADPDATITLPDENSVGWDDTLEALYNSDRQGGLGSSSPKVSRWLGDIRKYFPTPAVHLMQRDALERLGLQELLLQPEWLQHIEPDVHLVGQLLMLSKVLPDNTRETAREVVRRVVEQLEKKLRLPLLEALRGALTRSTRHHRPRAHEINWRQTIRENLKHYQPALGTIVPERWVGYGRKGKSLRRIILLVDQSGSMAESVVYAGVLASVLASVRTLTTHLVVFDTEVADVSDFLHDPVELLLGAQLGGGTDIGKALGYAQTLITAPHDTILVLISDLFEGPSPVSMFQKLKSIQDSGATLVALLALSNSGAAAFDHKNAQTLAALGIPAFACSPDRFPELMSAALDRRDWQQWAEHSGIILKN